ncbi:MAG: acyl-CoA thioester hydrolase [Methanobacteriota archaeon]|mgnify:CR=1 FL=1|jgi:acyl-CoA thioester hydrolase|uniref:Thioesterase family protein n=1 Tax=Halorutilus salinus TaxID=2487751 RepID=A0A9Q4C5A6_9EURY|nr:thioesterase family protein [Halorutilus salinus]MCX2819355.1 thioesterase family protein [Halorutilus salinus]
MEGYPYVTQLDVRFRDLDTMGHVNNAVYATYLEQARVAYYDDVLDLGIDELGFVLAHLEADYERPIHHGEEVRVGLRTADMGERSMRTGYRIEADGTLAATAETVQVAVDEDGNPRAVPEDWRSTVERFEGQ